MEWRKARLEPCSQASTLKGEFKGRGIRDIQIDQYRNPPYSFNVALLIFDSKVIWKLMITS
jgi:hypothetical protein